MNQEDFKELLRGKGLKVTSQRLLVLQIMAEHPGEHLTTEEIYDLVRKTNPEIGLATIYRTVQVLVDLHLIDKISFDDDVARYRLLLENLRGAGTRAAHFHTSVVCCFPNGNVLEAEGDCHGTIAYAPQGENGFGYDPVFFVPELRKTFAQLTPEEKNAISHRGVALRAFGEKLKEYMENH